MDGGDKNPAAVDAAAAGKIAWKNLYLSFFASCVGSFSASSFFYA